MPMEHFTQQEQKPSEHTLHIIRQIAYACNILYGKNREAVYYIN